MKDSTAVLLTTVAGVAICAALLLVWTISPSVGQSSMGKLDERIPGMDGAPPDTGPRLAPLPVPGQPVFGTGTPADIPGEWPWFRGPNGDATVTASMPFSVPLATSWPDGRPKELWRVEMGQGYAAPVVRDGCLYVLDYVQDECVLHLRGLRPQTREKLAEALESVALDPPEPLEDALRQVFLASEASADVPVSDLVDEAEFGPLVEQIRQLAAESGEKLTTALKAKKLEALNTVDRSTDTMRCLSLLNGVEIWRNGYPVVVAADHGMSRTVAALAGDCVISFGPKCHVACWDTKTGECRWIKDLVGEYGAKVPTWYAGQCPFVDGDRLILGTGGEALLVAIDCKTGKEIWRTPNDRGWAMTHSSIVSMEFGGQRMYLYCGSGGLAGISTEGKLLWDTTAWKIRMATCPSPVVLPGGRIFLCGGYNSGAMILQLVEEGGRITAETVRKFKPRQFSSEQQTPILYEGYLYASRQDDGQLVCLDLKGRQIWNSGNDKIDAGPYIIANGSIYALDDTGGLIIVKATHQSYQPLPPGRMEVIENAVESWGPLVLVGGRLIVRDMTRMICLDVSEAQP